MRYQLVVRLTSDDVGSRVVIRWRRPAPAPATAAGSAEEAVTDVLGVLTAADDTAFTVRKSSGELVVVPRDRALAGKVIPPARR
jgi:hypothetical protein